MFGGRGSALDSGEESSGLRLDSSYLASLRDEAKRRRVWFRVLSWLDRRLVDLAIRVVDRPRSMVLIMALAKVVVKIKKALMSPLKRLMDRVGRPLAKKISMIALRWGYRGAVEWAEDEGFIKYLTVIDMNSVPGFRLSDALSASWSGGGSA